VEKIHSMHVANHGDTTTIYIESPARPTSRITLALLGDEP
jgi:hypothetical protein